MASSAESSRVLGPDDLVLCAGTAPAASFRERVGAAAAAGYAGLSLFVADYRRARDAGLSDAEMRRMLSDHGLAIAELDPLLRWLPAGLGAGASAEGAGFFAYGEDDFYAVADALGARSMNVVVFTDTPFGTDRLAEAFGALCDRAAAHDLRVHLEFLPWTQVPDLGAALAIVERAGRDNGGVMLDTWHHFRSGQGPDALRAAPGARILGVQMSDAPAAAEADLADETLHRRLPPGEGDIDLVGLVQALDAIGSRAPIGVEVYSDALAALPADEAARRTGEAARRVLAKARR